jgi:small subunit ribosomal protein S2
LSTAQIKKFLEAGVHFGHQTRKWNPKMAPFIFGEKNKIHIIDLQKTLACVNQATQFIEEIVAAGKEVLFVGTKKQAQISLEEAAKRSQSPFVTQRWLGGCSPILRPYVLASIR